MPLAHPAESDYGGCKCHWHLPNIFAGINQTIMMSLAMVVIAAMIGGRRAWHASATRGE